MGYNRNHAIVVSDHGYGDHLVAAHTQATALRMCVSPIVEGVVNHVRSFACLADGSKEGWPESDTGDAAREAFVAYLRFCAYDDGSSPLSWAEIQYGDDENVTKVLASSDDDRAAFRKASVSEPSHVR